MDNIYTEKSSDDNSIGEDLMDLELDLDEFGYSEEGDEDLVDPALDESFYVNIIDKIDEDKVDKIVLDLDSSIEDDKQSRSLYDEYTAKGIEELGFDRSDTSGPAFSGASVLKTPLLAQAAIEFQSQAQKELMPPSGAARATTYIDDDPELEAVRQRVEDYNNYLINIGMEDYQEGFDQLLFFLSLLGSVFRKVYYSGTQVKVDTIHVQDFVVPWSTKSLSSCPRMTHILRLHKHEIYSNFKNNLWRRCDLKEGDESSEVDTATQSKLSNISGITKDSTKDDRHLVHEVHTYANIEGEDDDDESEKPYIITYLVATKKVLSVRRNWVETDINYKPRAHFIHYKFLPWDGFYGIGLVQLLAGLATASSGALRALMDSAMASNIPGGLINSKATTQGMKGSNQSIITPGQWTKINLPAGSDDDIRKHFLPSSQIHQPSTVLMSLLQWISTQAEKFGSISVKDMMGADKQAPVGTTLALIEQQGIIFSGIHRRQHRSFARELVLINDRLFESIGDEFGAEDVTTVKGSLTVFREDFDGKVAVVPASDPSIFSAAQRVSQAQALVQMATEAKAQGVDTDMRQVFIKMAKVLGAENTERIFPQEEAPAPPPSMDPVSEFAAIMRGLPVKAGRGQNHASHIQYLTTVRQDPAYSSNITPPQMSALDSLISDHVASMATEEAMGSLGAALPPPTMDGQPSPIPPQIQAMVAQAVTANAQQLALSRPPSSGDQSAAISAIREDTQRKLEDDHRKAELRVAEIKSKHEKEIANVNAEVEKARLERDKFNYTMQKDAADFQRHSQASSNSINSQILMNDKSIKSKEEIELMKANSKESQTRAKIISDQKIEAEKLASEESIAVATLSSDEQIAAAGIAAEFEKEKINAVDRALGEQMKLPTITKI